MLEFVFDQDSLDHGKLTHRFGFPQKWQMNLARSMGSCQGIAELLLQRAGSWVMATPICWQATHNDAMIVAVAADDTSAYFHALEKFLEQDDTEIIRISHDLWVFDAKFLGDLSDTDLDSVMHRSLHPFLQAMPKSWQTWWTETQMLFQTVGSKINGIWVWGGGPWRVSKTLYANGGAPEFQALSPLPWNFKKIPRSGVVLVSHEDAAAVYAGLLSSGIRNLPFRIWWRDGYQDYCPERLWQRIKTWVKHAN